MGQDEKYNKYFFNIKFNILPEDYNLIPNWLNKLEVEVKNCKTTLCIVLKIVSDIMFKDSQEQHQIEFYVN